MSLDFAPKDTPTQTEREKLIASMKTTAVSRYNASNRLSWQGKFTFAVSTLFSLGLIFIPLMQLAKAPLRLNGDVLGAIQIFLAVSILVYSIVIGTARYELRSEQLNDCGDKVKDLIRELRVARNNSESEPEFLLETQRKYAIIISDVENHKRSDYLLTILRSPDIYTLTPEARIIHWIKYLLSVFVPYIPSLALVIIEATLITDMFGATSVFSRYLTSIPAINE
ncbi:SLATT domain-containing protein [Paracidovorax avenae]|uniref:SLATT domain-containing protein n=1 Tax=Paracidovorax avenae TaxID=80867 RepID=UPI000FE1D284|nr:SLATT domain-containing protein [Paracidovorax avenae]